MSDYPPPRNEDAADTGTPTAPSEPRSYRFWHLFAVGAVALFLGVAIGSAGDTEPEQAAAPSPVETVTVTETVTEQAPAPAEEPEEVSVTPTLEPTVDPSIGALVFQNVFEDNRSGLADAIESDFGPVDVESVDQLAYDPDTQTIRLAVTSAYQGEDRRSDVAWALTRAWVDFYGEDGLVGASGISPTLDMTVSSVRYICTGEFMMRLVDRDATRDDWEATCRS